MNTNPAQFRKKPVVIEAVQIDKRMDLTSPPWWAEAVQQNRVILRGMGKFTRDLPMVEISTLEGIMTGVQGDWIIRGVQGELYPCKPDIFAATYEPVSAPTSHPIPTGATGEDERKAFEAWWRRTRGLTIAKQHYFELPEVYSSWEAWQARASVDAPAADDAEVES
jgi:hypothetical protein